MTCSDANSCYCVTVGFRRGFGVGGDDVISNGREVVLMKCTPMAHCNNVYGVCDKGWYSNAFWALRDFMIFCYKISWFKDGNEMFLWDFVAVYFIIFSWDSRMTFYAFCSVILFHFECYRPSFLAAVFYYASAFNGNIQQWNVANVVNTLDYSKSICMLENDLTRLGLMLLCDWRVPSWVWGWWWWCGVKMVEVVLKTAGDWVYSYGP